MDHSRIVTDAVSIPLAGVSTIACIIALGVLLYYKMWHSFIYRLVLYMFTSLIVSSLVKISYVSYVVDVERSDSITIDNAFNITTFVVTSSCLAVSFMLMSSITVSIYLLALHHCQFSYKSDICLLILSILYFVIVLVLMIILKSGDNRLLPLTLIVLTLPLFVKIVFTALTLVPLCCRACGYNLCMKTAATIESHRKALREILPFFILIVPSFLFVFLFLISLISISFYDKILYILYGIPELISSLSFALHVYFIRKRLKRLRSKRGIKQYGSINQGRNHPTTMYTSEGMSESCITEPLIENESEVDTRVLSRKEIELLLTSSNILNNQHSSCANTQSIA